METRKTALITGSTSGIGWGIAGALAAQGANIILHGLGDRVKMDPMARELGSMCSVKVAVHDADLAMPAEADRLITDTEPEFGTIEFW